jgi:hypothetical protein
VRHFQLASGFFLLNPEGDLPATQDTFEAWLRKLGLRVRLQHLKAVSG